MADDKTFLEKYSEHLRTGASDGFDKLTKQAEALGLLARGGPDNSDLLPTAAGERELPDFMKNSKPGQVPSAGDILGGGTPAPAAAAPTAEATPAAETATEELPPETMEDVLKELDALVGMVEIKENVKTLVNLLKIQDERKAHELPIVEIGLHQAYLGNPGTGKTTLARIIGRVYRASGRLSKGHLVETDRQGLVGGFVGQTAIKTQEKLEAAKGGVLFVDEAYSLVPEGGDNDFGQEAITTILKFMEDNRDDFVFVAAGYPVEMQRFLDSNPGLVSRFNDTIHFPDYSPEELYAIFSGMTEKNHYTLAPAVEAKVLQDFEWFVEHKNRNFANGRQARKYFEALVENQANRLSKSKKANTKAQLKRVTLADLPQDLAKLI